MTFNRVSGFVLVSLAIFVGLAALSSGPTDQTEKLAQNPPSTGSEFRVTPLSELNQKVKISIFADQLFVESEGQFLTVDRYSLKLVNGDYEAAPSTTLQPSLTGNES
ncbi:hypothetical protein QM565_04160 [Geitlerinema splendidum]|nr:hypothetical protein [Geitlerinema splendidum]